MKEIILGKIVAIFYRILASTYRYQFRYECPQDKIKITRAFQNQKSLTKENLIFAFFHQNELALLGAFMDSLTGAMVSQSKDGSIMSSALKSLGYFSLRGSSSKRSIGVFIEALKAIRSGYNFCMAVDGPKGPIYKVKPGVIQLSIKTKRPIVPTQAHPKKYHLFKKAWNQAKLPFPFSKIDIVFKKIDYYQIDSLENKLSEKIIDF